MWKPDTSNCDFYSIDGMGLSVCLIGTSTGLIRGSRSSSFSSSRFHLFYSVTNRIVPQRTQRTQRPRLSQSCSVPFFHYSSPISAWCRFFPISGHDSDHTHVGSPNAPVDPTHSVQTTHVPRTVPSLPSLSASWFVSGRNRWGEGDGRSLPDKALDGIDKRVWDSIGLTASGFY